MKLLQWNIWNQEDINNIVNELKRIDADIVCIQELSFVGNDKTSIDILNKVYPHIYFEIADTFEDGRSQANAILSKYPFIEKSKNYVQNPGTNKNDYSKEGRIYIEVSVKCNDRILNIGTTHLSYTHKFEETELKDKEVSKLISIIKDKTNYIFTGDLNTVKTSKYISQIEKYYINHGTDYTWTTKPFSYNGFEVSELEYKLDYVFTSDDIKVQSIETIDTKYSDHLPILCEIID